MVAVATEAPACTVVLGYLPDVDYPHAGARAAALPWRLSLVCPGYAADEYGYEYDSALVTALLPALLEGCPRDRVEVNWATAEALAFADLGAALAPLTADPAATGPPPERIRLHADGKPSALVELESWTAAGGPAPYADSWVLAVYRDAVPAERIRSALVEAAAEQGIAITIVDGLPSPRISWWTRIRHLL